MRVQLDGSPVVARVESQISIVQNRLGLRQPCGWHRSHFAALARWHFTCRSQAVRGRSRGDRLRGAAETAGPAAEAFDRGLQAVQSCTTNIMSRQTHNYMEDGMDIRRRTGRYLQPQRPHALSWTLLNYVWQTSTRRICWIFHRGNCNSVHRHLRRRAH
jgi:hypothetical protein